MTLRWIAVMTVALLFFSGCDETSSTPASTEDSNTGQDLGVDEGDPDTAVEATTYYGHTKPIFDAKCTGCHQEGGAGPFPLTTYEEVVEQAELARTKVVKREMPPWLAADDCADYQLDWSLSHEEIALIDAWYKEGTQRGEPAEEAAPLEKVERLMTRVDHRLSSPQPYTPQLAPDDYRCFVMDWPETAAVSFITGFGVEPDQKDMVHHVIAYLAPPSRLDEVAALEAEDELPGYTCFGGTRLAGAQGAPGRDSVRMLGGWAPGGQGSDMPPNTGIPVEAGSKIIIQVHYNVLDANPASDQTAVLFKVDPFVNKFASIIPWANPSWPGGSSMPIPAGEGDVMHRYGADPTGFSGAAEPFIIYTASLHMHLLGTSGKLWIEREDGSEECLLDVPAWDFSWQFPYPFDEPKTIYPGDKLWIECHWDNSAQNQPWVGGERLEPREANWGEGTTDEMCVGFFYATQL